MKRIPWSWRLVIIFGAIIIASIVAIILVLNLYKPTKDTIEFEIVKSLLQILAVLVLGQVVSLVVAMFNIDRQKAEARTEFQRDILHRLIRTYIAVKKHRRLLRAKGLTPPYTGEIQKDTVVRFDAYDEQMQLINEIELEIEAIRHEVESSPTTFSDSQSLARNLQQMEDYLRKLIKLYEQKHSAFNGEPLKLQLAKINLLPKSDFELSDFVGKAGGSKFVSEFAKSYYNSSKAIREDILK